MSALDPRELRAIFGRLMIQMAMAATTLFTIGAGVTGTDGVCGTVSRGAGGRDAVDVGR